MIEANARVAGLVRKVQKTPFESMGRIRTRGHLPSMTSSRKGKEARSVVQVVYPPPAPQPHQSMAEFQESFRQTYGEEAQHA